MKIRVSDYLAKRIAEAGVRHVFMISGGGAMHLNDAIGKNKDLEYVCNHHEQACAMAVEGYNAAISHRASKLSARFCDVLVAVG